MRYYRGMKARSLSLSVLALAMLVPSPAGATGDICSAPGVCEYAGPTAPLLNRFVCWGPDEPVTLLVGGCDEGQSIYYASHGTVEGGIVSPLEVLGDACGVAGVCIPEDAPDGGQAQVICCEWGDCFPKDTVACNGPDSMLAWCDEGVTNLDGSVDCFSGEPIP